MMFKFQPDISQHRLVGFFCEEADVIVKLVLGSDHCASQRTQQSMIQPAKNGIERVIRRCHTGRYKVGVRLEQPGDFRQQRLHIRDVFKNAIAVDTAQTLIGQRYVMRVDAKSLSIGIDAICLVHRRASLIDAKLKLTFEQEFSYSTVATA